MAVAVGPRRVHVYPSTGGGPATATAASDPFRHEILCLLSCGNPDLILDSVLATTEDFVWHRVFFVVTADVAAKVKAAAGPSTSLTAFERPRGGPFTTSGRVGVTGSVFTLSQLAHTITDTYGGDEYFDPGHARPYEYCYLLLQVRHAERGEASVCARACTCVSAATQHCAPECSVFGSRPCHPPVFPTAQ